jgi:hypothetical protein
MAQGPMQFGADNNAGPNQPNQTILRAQNTNQETLVVKNEPAPGLTAGSGLRVQAGPVAVWALGGIGVYAIADSTGVRAEGPTGVFGTSVGPGNGVWGQSTQSNGVYGQSSSSNANGVFGENTRGGCGVAGRTWDNVAGDRGAVQGESMRRPGSGSPSHAGKAAGVYGYSETGYGGHFVTAQAFGNVRFADSGGLRVIGDIVKTHGEYSEALPHPDGSQRLLYAPLCPESWYEDYGRAQLVGGRVEVELDSDFVAVLGVEDGEYHVFLTPEGDTQGLYVESRSARSFIVREQQAGTSNTTFSYRVATKNKHRQPERLAILDEPEEMTMPPQTPSPPTSDQPDPLV